MKKIIFILSLCLLFVACVPEDKENDSVSNVQNLNDDYEIIENNNEETILFEEQVLMDENDIRVIAKSLDLNGRYGPVIYMVVENNSNTEITVITENDTINYKYSEYFTGVDVPAGQSAKSEIDINKYQLDQGDMIGSTILEFEIKAYNKADSREIYASEQVKMVLEFGNSLNGAYNHFTEIDLVEQTIYEDDYVRIDAQAINVNGDFGPEIEVKIENLSNVRLYLETTDGSVNGYMADFRLYSGEISPGDTIYDTIYISKNALNHCEITDIYCIELGFFICTIEYEPVNIYTPFVEVFTGLENTMQEKTLFDLSTPLYENDGIRIIPIGAYEDATHIGPSLLFYIENNSNEDTWIIARDVAVNDIKSSATIQCYILSGKKAIVDLTLMERELPTKNAVLDLTILDDKSPLDATTDVEFRFQIGSVNYFV